MKNCLVLLCTYNGEKYLQQQLDSIYNQEGIDVSVLVADDCSSDSTVKILEENKHTHKNFDYFINKNNKGYAKNFIDLIYYAKDMKYDFYALSDQDDVWFNNKLLCAIESLESSATNSLNNNGVLYSSNAIITDGILNVLGKTSWIDNNRKNIKYSLISGNFVQGCTVVFDRKFIMYFTSVECNDKIYSHDYLLAFIALFCADYIFDDNVYMYYRQHGANQIGSRSIRFFNNARKNLKKNKEISNIKFQLVKYLLNNYSNNLSRYDLKLLTIFLGYKKSLKLKFKLLFLPEICKDNSKNKLKILLNLY